jgi:hypothetical protein
MHMQKGGLYTIIIQRTNYKCAISYRRLKIWATFQHKRDFQNNFDASYHKAQIRGDNLDLILQIKTRALFK